VRWLSEETDEALVNMVCKEYKVQGFTIPYWESKRALKKYERLVVKKAPKRKADAM
jgi:hypothetical protein